MSYEFYKVVHFLGIFMLFLSLGGVIMRAINGLDRTHGWRKQAAITHGIGMVLALVGGFGLLVKLGIKGVPGWAWGKLFVWVLFGGMIALAGRKPRTGKLLWWSMLLLGVVAAWLARVKPF